MSEIGYGPLERIDGPLPQAPQYGLLQAAANPSAGVTIVPDADAGGIERWLNGVEVWPYPPGPAFAWDACAPGTAFVSKDDGADVTNPQFAAMTIYLPERCKARKVPDQQAFKARATTALTAVEGAAVAREFMTGDVLPLNPHLSDGNGSFPLGNTATSPVNGLSVLEDEVASSDQLGVIHMSPGLVTFLRAAYAIDDRNGILQTGNGIPVINDFGYAGGSTPTGHSAPASGQTWAYATGPIEIRRSEIFTTPDNVSQALERGTGGSDTGRPNTIVYRAERYYLVDWDTQLQSAVLIDLCRTACP